MANNDKGEKGMVAHEFNPIFHSEIPPQPLGQQRGKHGLDRKLRSSQDCTVRLCLEGKKERKRKKKNRGEREKGKMKMFPL